MGKGPKTKSSAGGGRKAKGGNSAAKGQAQWRAAHAHKEGLSASAHGGELARRAARVKLAEKLLERAEKAGGSSAPPAPFVVSPLRM